MTAPIVRIINRQGPWDTSYHVYAKSGGYPNESGDGVYAGTATLNPWDSSVSFSWTPPSDGLWYLIAEPISGDVYGPIARIN